VAGEQFGRYLGSQVGGRLVQQEHGGLNHEHAAHGQHLPLAAAEPSGPPGQHLAEPREHPGHVLDPRAHLASVQQVPAHLQVLPDGQRSEDVVGLRHVADPGPGDLLRRQPGDIAVAGQDPAGRRLDHPGQRLQQGGLAGPVRPDDGCDRPGGDRDRDAVDDVAGAVPGPDVLGPQNSVVSGGRQC
jgi:hypothetical protein